MAKIHRHHYSHRHNYDAEAVDRRNTEEENHQYDHYNDDACGDRTLHAGHRAQVGGCHRRSLSLVPVSRHFW